MITHKRTPKGIACNIKLSENMRSTHFNYAVTCGKCIIQIRRLRPKLGDEEKRSGFIIRSE